jgi:hypothetical protein
MTLLTGDFLWLAMAVGFFALSAAVVHFLDLI